VVSNALPSDGATPPMARSWTDPGKESILGFSLPKLEQDWNLCQARIPVFHQNFTRFPRFEGAVGAALRIDMPQARQPRHLLYPDSRDV
jgi:hypothetical protein